MNPEQIAAQLGVLLEKCVVGEPPRLTVEQGHLVEFARSVILNQAEEIKRLKEPKP